MKKVLSVLLSVALVVGMLPMLFLPAVAAEGESAGSAAAKSDFPELVITEMIVNTTNFNTGAATWRSTWPAETGVIAMPPYQEPYFIAANPAPGASVSGLYVAQTSGDGTVTYSTASGNAVDGVQYYLQVNGKSTAYYDVFRYIEVYNASSEPVNLYDYKLAFDKNATQDGDTVAFNPILPGGVAAAYHPDGFERVSVEAGQSLAGYYTSSSSGTTFTPCSAFETANGGDYFRRINNEFFVTNPSAEEGAWLQPGKCAVLWMYSYTDVWASLKTEYFKYYYSSTYTASKFGYDVDFDDVMVLGVSCLPDSTYVNYYGYDPNGFKMAESDQGIGQCIYGVVPKDMNDTDDLAREASWTSWVRWDEYVALPTDATVLATTVTAGSTDVTGGTYFYIDPVTGEYAVPTAGYGADANGRAVSGYSYYTLNLQSAGRKAMFSNYYNETGTNFLYGTDQTKNIREGCYYNAGASNLTPGFLTFLQEASLPDGSGVTGTPDLVITEVMPDNESSDRYAYLEIVNTSGGTINLYDYSVVGRTNYNAGAGSEYFNTVSHLIPGNIGTILSADYNVNAYPSSYLDAAPVNSDYSNGWLAPGEVALIWGYNADAFLLSTTFDDFYNYYHLDPTVKVFAMDADNSAASGRTAVGLVANNSAVYGIVKNSNLTFMGQMYHSKADMNPVVYQSGQSSSYSCGISPRVCESFVFTNSSFVIARNQQTLGEEYGYQFVWNRVEGLPNTLGAYLGRSYLSHFASATNFTFTTALNNSWKASPAVLLPAQQTEMLMADAANARYVVYYQEFDKLATAYGNEKVYNLLGLADVANAAFAAAHAANVEATEPAGDFLQVKNGKLTVTNNGSEDDYILLYSSELLDAMQNGNFTVEFVISALSGSDEDGFATILYGFDAESGSYGEAGVTVGGQVFNRAVYRGAALQLADAVTDTVSTENVTVRIESGLVGGTRVYVNNTLVSDSRASAGDGYSNWNMFAETGAGNALVLKTSPGVTVSYDAITAYSDALYPRLTAATTPTLAITEILANGGNRAYAAGVSGTLDLSGVRYIELTNIGMETVDLADFVLLRTADADQGLFHAGNALRWGYAVRLADWLGKNGDPAYISAGGNAGTSIANPAAENAVLAPGRSALVFFVEEENFAAGAAQALSLTTLLKAPEGTPVITVVTGNVQVTRGSVTAAVASAFPLTEKDFLYGVGRDAAGVDFTTAGTHDYRYVDSVADYDLALTGGDVADTAGNAVHYVYGSNDRVSARVGSIYNKADTPVLNVYVLGKSTLEAAGQYNAGRLLSVQTVAMQKMLSRVRNGYETAGIEITEYIPVTTDDRTGTRNAFSALEITNTSERAINLYDYAVATCNTDSHTMWTGVSALRRDQIVSLGHKWYSQLYLLKNTDQGTLQPGASAVIWFFTEDTYNLASDAPTRAYVSVEDFRNYWASNGNAALKATVNGSYTVPVIICVVDNERSPLDLAVNGTASIGLTTARRMQFGNVVRADSIISRVTVPLDNMYRISRWEKNELSASVPAFYSYTDTPVELGGEITLGNSAAGLYRYRYYIPCEAAAVAVAGTTYYEWNDWGEEDYLPLVAYAVGNSAAGLYAFRMVYTACGSEEVAASGVTYYALNGDQYEAVAGLSVGDSVAGYYTGENQLLACAADDVILDGTDYYYAPYVAMPILMEGASVAGYYTYDAEGRLALCDENEIVRADRDYYRTPDATSKMVIGSTIDATGYFAGGVWQSGGVVDGLQYNKRRITWTGEAVALAEKPSDLSACFVRVDDTTFEFAAGEYPEETVFYHLYYYSTVEFTQTPVNTAYNFVNGNVVDTILVSSRIESSHGVLYGIDETDVPFVQLNILSIGAHTATLGYLLPEQQTMLAAVHFLKFGKTADGSLLYFREGLIENLESAKVVTTGASVTTTEGTAISFSGAIGQSINSTLQNRFGSANMRYGMYTMLAEALKGKVDATQVSEKYDDQGTPINQMGMAYFNGAKHSMPANYYSTGFLGVAYVSVQMPIFGEVRMLADAPLGRTVVQVLTSAMLDTSPVETAEYCYAVGDGTWSRYTASQRARFAVYCNAH